MDQFNSVYDIFWNSVSEKDQNAYALLSIPVWFDRDVAFRLFDNFHKPANKCFYKITRNFLFVFKYENRGWYFDQNFRQYLLEKAQIVFQENINAINNFLYTYYLKKSECESLIEKREFRYLYFYHQLMIEPGKGMVLILKELVNNDNQNLFPCLRSLIHICEMPPKLRGEQPVYLYLKLYFAFLESEEEAKEDIKLLKKVSSKLDDVENCLKKDRDVILL